MDDVQIWDDVVTMRPSPEAMKAIREWFNEMVESGRIKVLTVEREYGSVTFITAGEVPLADREGE